MNAQCGLFDIAIDLTAQGRGRDVSPGYAYEQFGFPYPAYQSTIRLHLQPASRAETHRQSGPGAGCNTLGSADTTCSGGIDPGPLPGLERYPNPPGPPPGKSPKAGNVYEYWSLWPAPAHNSELNHLYYNPRITYDPPVDSAGVSYPQMNAANTANWTHVVADPWAESLAYVDLTAQVTVGIWCNSDWSVGHEDDSAYCRTNGTGPGATSSTKATANGDYRYPWAPPGINPDDGVQPTTAKSIALSKCVQPDDAQVRPEAPSGRPRATRSISMKTTTFSGAIQRSVVSCARDDYARNMQRRTADGSALHRRSASVVRWRCTVELCRGNDTDLRRCHPANLPPCLSNLRWLGAAELRCSARRDVSGRGTPDLQPGIAADMQRHRRPDVRWSRT